MSKNFADPRTPTILLWRARNIALDVFEYALFLFFNDMLLMWRQYQMIFHFYAHCDILDKFLLRDSDEELESRTTEKIEVSSAKSLAFEVNPSGKS